MTNDLPGISDVISGYTLTKLLGDGGFGEVYKGISQEGDVAALKFVKDHSALHQFQRLIKVQQAIHSDYVVRILGHDLETRPGYITMELVEGCTFREFIDALPEDLAHRTRYRNEIYYIMVQIARGLKDAHDQGVCHLDLKPSNVLISYRGEVKLTDFEFSRSLSGELSLSLATQDGIAGTLPYMSPEQRRGQKADAKSDIYTFGVMLFEALVGELPQPGDTPSDFTGDDIFDHIFARSFARPKKRIHNGGRLLEELLKLPFARQDHLRMDLIHFLEREGLDNRPQRPKSGSDSSVFPIQKDFLPQKVVVCKQHVELSSFYMFHREPVKSYHPFQEFHLNGYQIDPRQSEQKIIEALKQNIVDVVRATGVGTYVAKVISGSDEELFTSNELVVNPQTSTNPDDILKREAEELRQEALLLKQEAERIKRINQENKLQRERETQLLREIEREERRRDYIERYGEYPEQSLAELMLLAPMMIPVIIVALCYFFGGM